MFHSKALRLVGNEEDTLRTVTCLLDHGADPNLLDETGVSDLTRAAFLQSTKTAECLLSAGADPNYIFQQVLCSEDEVLLSPIHACFTNKGKKYN